MTYGLAELRTMTAAPTPSRLGTETHDTRQHIAQDIIHKSSHARESIQIITALVSTIVVTSDIHYRP